MQQSGFFEAKFLDWVSFQRSDRGQLFGEKELISGYEGLSVTVFLSSKRLIPYVEITYERKAPISAKVDDVLFKL